MYVCMYVFNPNSHYEQDVLEGQFYFILFYFFLLFNQI